jgi:hypothetical protein
MMTTTMTMKKTKSEAYEIVNEKSKLCIFVVSIP